MSTDERRVARRRTYSLVGMVLFSVLLIVALAAFLHVGQKEIDQTIYQQPHKTLLALGKAEYRFRRNDLDGDGVHAYAESLEDLYDAGCITHNLAEGEVGDPPYHYEIVHADEKSYAIRATPAEVTSGSLHYYMDQTHTVRASAAGPADAESSVYYHPFQGVQWSGGGGP